MYYARFLIHLSIVNFLSNFTGQDLQNFSFFVLSQSILVMHQKDPNQAKDHFNMVSVTLEVLRMISDRIVDFRFFI